MNILSIPPNVMLTIFTFLDQRDLINSVRKTCKLWYQLSHERTLWKTIHMQKFSNFHFCAWTFKDMLSKVCDSVETLYMDLKQLDSVGIAHENITCSNLKRLYLYWEDAQSMKNGRKDYTLHCHDGSQLRLYLPILSSKYTHLKALHLFSHVVFIKDLLELFLELEEIEIEYCDFSFDDAETTVETFFNNHQCIKHLSIRFSVFRRNTLSFILTNVSELRSLDLSNSNFNCDEINMKGIQQKWLEKLVLTNTRSNDRLLGQLVQNASELTYVSIGDCADLTNNGLEILAENCPKLKTLIINEAEYSKCNITDSGLQKVAEMCKNIQVLKMIHCDEIGDIGVQTLSESCRNLTVLEAAGCTAITDAAVLSIIKHCPLIEKLDLGHCVQLTSASINSLLLTRKNLRHLNLETCHRLADINLENRFVDKQEMTDYANADDCRSSSAISTDEINLTINSQTEVDEPTPVEHGTSKVDGQGIDVKENIGEISDSEQGSLDTWDTISKCYLPHCHIRNLNLGFCSKISNKCLKQIAKHCPDLHTLNLQGCAMVTNAGVLAVVEGCKNLRKLNISGGSVCQTSRLTDDCLSHIAKHCKNLTKLTIIKNHHVTTEGVFQVIKECPNIEELSFAPIRSHASSGIKPESLTKAAGEVQGKTICIKIVGTNAKVTVTRDIEYKVKLK